MIFLIFIFFIFNYHRNDTKKTCYENYTNNFYNLLIN